eukprot:3256476-Lingulodinium_polyedra.AAC.1
MRGGSETGFDYLPPDTNNQGPQVVMEETKMKIEPPPGLPGPRISHTIDYWTREGATWTRHR